MARLPDVPNVLRVRVLFDLNGKVDQGLRLFFRWSGTTPTTAALGGLAGAFHSALLGHGLAGLMTTTYTMTSVELTDLSTPMGAVGEAMATIVGTRVGTPLPVEAAFVSAYTITRRYRGGHPRSYWPFGVAGDLTGPQKWKTTAVTTFADFVQAVIATFIGQSATGTTTGAQVGISYYEGFTSVENPLTHRWRNVPDLRTAPLVTNTLQVLGRDFVGSFRRRRFKVD